MGEKEGGEEVREAESERVRDPQSDETSVGEVRERVIYIYISTE